MYYPYFRGKQYELVTIRETAEMLSDANFVPVIEPVKESVNSLRKALDAMTEAEGHAVLILNPQYGDHSQDHNALDELFENQLRDSNNVSAGFILSEDTQLDQAIGFCQRFDGRPISLIHAGFSAARGLVEHVGDRINEFTHIFLDDSTGKLYRRHFKDARRILLRDGFERRTNREHPPVEFFSDLHITFEDESMDGFGDFLIVGDDYSESGGPAYAIAIHLTFISPEQDDAMWIHHFISDRTDTPTDPAGKFAEALEKLVLEVERPDSPILRSDAVEEFISLRNKGHFPGLGYVKKLSMKHHIETLANFFSRS